MKLIRKASNGIEIPPIEEARLDNTAVRHFVPVERELSLEEKDARNYIWQKHRWEEYNKTHLITSDKSKERATLNNAANNLTIGINSVDPQYKQGPALVNSGLYTSALMYPTSKIILTHPYTQVALVTDGARNFVSQNGILKTYNLISNGKYGLAAISGLGDALDIYGVKSIFNPMFGSRLANSLALSKYTLDPYKAKINQATSDIATFLRTPINKNPFKEVREKQLLRSLENYKALNPSIDVEDVVLTDNVTPNYDPELALTLLKRRYINGGSDRIESNKGDYHSFNLDTPEEKLLTVSTTSYLPIRRIYRNVKQSHVGNTPFRDIKNTISDWFTLNTSPGTALHNSKLIITNSPLLNKLHISPTITVGHELDHVLNHDVKIPEGIVDFSHLPKVYRDYLSKDTELSARGSQLKNYFGLEEGQPFTTEMLKYAAKHYIPDTGVDNNMKLFFSGIRDWDKMAEWINKTSM